MTTQRKIEANRRNAQHSTGPRTETGKNKVKFNALKHGMTAETVVLPNEDAAAYNERLETWTRELNPPGKMGHYLAERVVRVSWQLDRADFHERDRLAKRLREAPAERERARDLAVTSLMNRLFDEAEATGHSGGPDLSREGPANVLAQLEASAEGCRRLLAEWTAIKEELDGETDADQETVEPLKDLVLIGQGRVLRLLGLTDGQAAIQARIDGRVAAIVQIQALAQEEMIAQFFAQTREEDPDCLEDDLPEPDDRNVRAAIDSRQVAALKRNLRSVVEGETRRLEALLAEHEVQEDGEDGVIDNEAAFDDSPEGERVHRYQSRWSRLLLRTLDAIGDLRKQSTLEASDPREQAKPAQQSAEAPAPVVVAQELTEEPAVGDMNGEAGPSPHQQAITQSPTAQTITPDKPGREICTHLHHEAPGSGSCSPEFQPHQESAKQTHREAAPADLTGWSSEPVRSSDGGRPRGGGLKM